MAKPMVHARSSARAFGGAPGDYLAVHDLMDSSKAAHATVKHRVVFHTLEGAVLVREVLGPVVGPGAATVLVALRHAAEDLGFVPPVDAFLAELGPAAEPWMRRPGVPGAAHCEADARRYKGAPAEYAAVHALVDRYGSAAHPDLGRVVLHHAFGCFVAELALGAHFVNSAGRTVFVRDLVEQHVLREFGRIPDLGDWVRPVPVRPWMAGAARAAPSQREPKGPEDGTEAR